MRRLRSVRVRLLLGFAPLALLMLVFAGKVLLMVGANESGREAYAQQAYETAEADFGRNRRGDLLQDWVASYNRGTTLVRMHRYEEARADLERALARVPAEYDCTVRVNLVLAMEGQADDLMTQRRAADAEQLYAAARELLRQGGCGSPESTSPSPGASGSQSASRRPSSRQPSTGQPSTGQSGQPSTGQSGQPTTSQPEPTSPEQRREQEQQQAQDADQRLDEKQQQAQREAEKQRSRESRRASATPTAPSSRPSQDPQQQESRLNEKNDEGQRSDREAKDRDDRSAGPTATAKRRW